MAPYLLHTCFHSDYLPVGDLHSLYHEQYGQVDGLPALVIHGGPGGGSRPSDARFFNPDVYRVILYDQRGAGKSTPTCELRENTTQRLIEDIESLRKHLAIEKWLVFGGSWGSTLALLYAQAYPDRVSKLVVRGIFLVRESELCWDTTGASQLFPEAYEKYLEPLAVEDRRDPLKGHYDLLMSNDRETQMRSVRALDAWVSTHTALPTEIIASQRKVKAEDEEWLLNFCKLNMYYIYHRCFIEDGQILHEENIARIRHIPCTIVQGRYDIFCPSITAWELHKALPGSTLVMIENAGHSASEPGIEEALVKACDAYGK